jgi:hypothetical protein
MSVVIVGGNDRMVRQYRDLCEKYRCRAKIFTQMSGSMGDKIGNPDRMVLFTNTVFHKMIRCAMSRLKGNETIIAHFHSSSISALRKILEAHTL